MIFHFDAPLSIMPAQSFEIELAIHCQYLSGFSVFHSTLFVTFLLFFPVRIFSVEQKIILKFILFSKLVSLSVWLVSSLLCRPECYSADYSLTLPSDSLYFLCLAHQLVLNFVPIVRRSFIAWPPIAFPNIIFSDEKLFTI